MIESHLDIFTSIYETKTWGNDGNIQYSGSSGGGSLPVKNIEYICFLKKFIIDNGIKSVVDVGCGTFMLGPIIFSDELNHIKYIGYDAYSRLIEKHSLDYKYKPNFSFVHLDGCHNPDKIQDSDLCIIKDVLQHWTTNEIYSFMDYIIANNKFKYILICNCANQFDDNLESDNQHRSHALSAKYLPLRKYNPTIVLTYNEKEVCLIK